MTKASLETPSDPLRVLNNKDIHEMICTFPSLLPKLAEELVRRFIKATHVSHDERNEVAGADGQAEERRRAREVGAVRGAERSSRRAALGAA